MTEVLQDQNEQRNPRPVGRFLLGLEEYEGRHDPFEFAMQYASRPGAFLLHKHVSAKVEVAKDLTIDDRDVKLEFAIERSAYVWRIIVAAERHKTQHLADAYLPHGGELYELRCAQPNSIAVYHEYGVQGRTLRSRKFEEHPLLQKLQGVVEHLLSGIAD